jgi:hypothetical protein
MANQSFNVFDKDKKNIGSLKAKDFYYAEDKAKKQYGDKYSHLMKNTKKSKSLSIKSKALRA